MGAWSVGRKAHGASLERGSKAKEQEVKTCSHYLTLYYLEW